MKKMFLKLLLIGSIVSSVMLNACEKENEETPDNPDYTQDKGEFKDLRDRHIYKWVKIGDQIWMAENLAFSDSGRHILSNDDWAYNPAFDIKPFPDGWCAYDNDKNGVYYSRTYGLLYQWEVAKAACPEGWHLPSDDEWTVLEQFIENDGHSGNVGSALRSRSGWDSGYNNMGNGTDDYGFEALPGGYRWSIDGKFSSLGETGVWWSRTYDYFRYNTAYVRLLKCYSPYDMVHMKHWSRHGGCSVRCIKD